MTTWHIQQNGTPKGPFSDGELKVLCEAGAVNGATLVWKQDYAQWRPLADTDFVHKSAIAPPPVASATSAAMGAGEGLGAAASASQDFIVEDIGLWTYFTRALTQKFATFSGRARRKEYWSFQLFYLIFLFLLAGVAIFIDGASGNIPERGGQPIALPLLIGGYVLVMLIPVVAVTVRRLHDIGMSGWWALLLLVPYIGGLIVLVFTLLPGQPHANAHGPAPVAALPEG
jgi:uncharacterized membrane protein YhaH (DUF805 family)